MREPGRSVEPGETSRGGLRSGRTRRGDEAASFAARILPVALLALAALSVSVTGRAGAQSPAPPFFVKAYGGTIVRNGGKCLDHGGEVSGSLVVLNDCAVAHTFTVRELPGLTEVVDGEARPVRNYVQLVAGTRVVGLRTAGARLSGAPTRGGLAGPAARIPPIGAERLLELQTPVGSALDVGEPRRNGADQVFVLDGDSILLASNRELVAQVLNGRGTNGTPIIVGPRRLADAEFWQFQAADGSDAEPTSAIVRLAHPSELQAYLGPSATVPVEFGTVFKLLPQPIFLGPEARAHGEGPAVPLVPFPVLTVPAGVTVRGDRRGTLLAPELRMSTGYEGQIFQIAGRDTRITGLRLRGPNEARDSSVELKVVDTGGILAWERFERTHVDHNEIFDFHQWAVRVRDTDPASDDTCTQTPIIAPATRSNHVRVIRNFVHHNLVQDRGYGVNANSGGFPLVEGNLFWFNRHAIAGTNSTPNTGYRARSNLVLWRVPRQDTAIPGIGFYTHDFDMHGTGDNGFEGIAGGPVEVASNTFFGTDPPGGVPYVNLITHYGVKVRGDSCDVVQIHHNIFLEPKDRAVNFWDGSLLGTTEVPWAVVADQPPQFDTWPHPAGRLGAGDFDGDGADDLFLATGTAFYYAPGGLTEWRLLRAGRTDRIDTLLFGDFDGDGRTDVLGKNGSNLMVSWGGASEWEVLNTANAGIADLATGDFDGDGRTDVFFGDGQHWYIAYGGNGGWQQVNTSGYRVGHLRFGDFDGDGTTDVLGYVGGVWQVSHGATTGWEPLGASRLNDVARLFVADLDGNGQDDLGLWWRTSNALDPYVYLSVSWGGKTDWTTVQFSWPREFECVGNVCRDVSFTEFPSAGAGRFLGGQKARLLLWSRNTLETGDVLQIVPSIGSAPSSYSQGEMR